MTGRLYAILDVDSIARIAGEISPELLADMACAAVGAGVTALQLRAKTSDVRQIIQLATAIKDAVGVEDFSPTTEVNPVLPDHSSRCHSVAQRRNLSSSGLETELVASQKLKLILNDRPDLALLCDFDGCHLGQDDLSLQGARRVLPRPHRLGLSTHSERQVTEGNATDADYLAIGPIFATRSKQNVDPVVGLQQFASLRQLTGKPLVAIGGITRHNARSVLDAGADSIALISELMTGAATAAALPEAMARNCADIFNQIL